MDNSEMKIIVLATVTVLIALFHILNTYKDINNMEERLMKLNDRIKSIDSSRGR